jgi:hypothetical protein
LLPTLDIRSRGSRELQSLFPLKSLGSLWLTPNPCVLPFRWTLGPSLPKEVKCVFYLALTFSSLALLRHLERLFLLARYTLSRIHVDHTPQPRVPRLSSLSLQHFRNKMPFFSHLLQNASENPCPDPQKFRTQGLATLSTAYQLSHPSEASLSPQHSWDSPFRAFLLTCSRSPLTKTSRRPCTSVKNLLGLLPVLQRFAPQVKPRLSCPPKV